MSEKPEDVNIDEGAGSTITGSAWMFYNHYNPDLLKAVQRVLVGEGVESAVEGLLERKQQEDTETA